MIVLFKDDSVSLTNVFLNTFNKRLSSGTILETQLVGGENIEHGNVLNIPISPPLSLLQTLFYTKEFMTL